MSDKQKEMEQNLEALKGELPDLLNSHHGRYVLMRQGKIVNLYDTSHDARSTGEVFFKDKKFSVVLLTTKTATKKTAKKTSKQKTAKQKAAKKLAATSLKKVPGRADIANVELQWADATDWLGAAKVYRIRPYHKGPDSLPWRCLSARIADCQPGPCRDKDGRVSARGNDYYLADEDCKSAWLSGKGIPDD
jgi:hypothetical protein